MQRIRIATRNSPLALWQAEYVRARLIQGHPDLPVELVSMTTQGDRMLGAPLAEIGGKGLFLKELEDALLNNTADIAVHSMKDVTVQLPPGLDIAVICERGEPRDAFVSNRYTDFEALPDGARVGTSSLRRQCQLLHCNPALEVVTLRGNVNTRLRKLDAGEFDAIILAAVGLERLGMTDRIAHLIETDICLPAVGQGALGIEIRQDDAAARDLLKSLNHEPTRLCVLAERAMNGALDGGCQFPVAAYARRHNGGLTLQGRVGSLDGARMLNTDVTGDLDRPLDLGTRAAENLIADGAREILREVYQ